MNLDTLIEILNDYREEFGGDAEVRLMTQQNWPFENRICGVTSGRDMNDASDDEDEDDDDQDVADDNTSTSSKVDRSATAASGLGKHVAIVDRDTPMRRGEDSGKPSESFPLRLDAV